jgi:hypothetical protein
MNIPVLTIITAILMTISANAEDKPKEQIEDSAKKIKELQKERIAALEAVVAGTTKLYSQARIEYGELLEPILMLNKARVEAAEKEADHIEIYKKTIESLKEFEQWAKNKHDAGRATEMPLLSIKARRLELEIALEKAKAKEAKGGK